MNGDVLGGGIVVAVAASLWMAYLVPSWLRRRQYLATERNAVRLQQTLRILAETAEVPQEFRVEASARDVAVHERMLRDVRKREDRQAEARALAEARLREAEMQAENTRIEAIEREAELSRQRAERIAVETRAAGAPPSRARLRRVRAVTSLFALAGLIALVVGIVTLVTSGGWFLAAGGAALLVVAVLVLGRLARRPVARSASPVARRQAPAPAERFVEVDEIRVEELVTEVEVQAVEWTPRRLPQPLHLKPGTAAAGAMAQLAAAERLREASARALLEAEAAKESESAREKVVPIRPRPSVPVEEPQAAPASRYAAMGLVGDLEDAPLDLDAVLRLRRSAG